MARKTDAQAGVGKPAGKPGAQHGSGRASVLLLRNVPLLSTLSDAQLGLLAQTILRRAYPRGATILKAGERTASLHIVVSGHVQVEISNRCGDEVILDILRPGEYFGEMGLLDDLPRSATVKAREACEILSLSKADFAARLKENHNLATAVQRGLVQRLRSANEKIGSLAAGCAWARCQGAAGHGGEY